MNIIIIGVGYVGLTQAACLASFGHKVLCVDSDASKVEFLKQNKAPFFEQGMDDLLQKALKNGEMIFSTDYPQNFKAQVVFLCVGTPPLPDGASNLSYYKSALRTLAKNIDDYVVIVNKSTVPVGTGEFARQFFSQYFFGDFSVVSNPEFLAEGTAVKDCLNPSRVVLGFEPNDQRAKDIMKKLYFFYDCFFLNTDLKTAELIKYAANSFLACEISFINSLARLCESLGCDVNDVSQGMRLDKRIGLKAFLNAGLGYGGSCFSKDIKSLLNISGQIGYSFDILEKVEEVNDNQVKMFVDKIRQSLGGQIKGKKIAGWGLAFKPETDDIRDAPAISVIKLLLQKGAQVAVYDPQAMSVAAKVFSRDVSYGKDLYQVVENADLLAIFTEWDEFKTVDFKQLKQRLKSANIVDGRNIFPLDEMKRKGFHYVSIGRPYSRP